MKSLLDFLFSGASNIIIGGLLSFIFLVAMLGVEGAGQLILLSIICTVGVGLIFWLGISYAVGWTVMLMLKLMHVIPNNGGVNTPRIVVDSDPDVNSISNYIRDARKYGFNDPDIRTKLLDVGWNNEKIVKAFSIS